MKDKKQLKHIEIESDKISILTRKDMLRDYLIYLLNKHFNEREETIKEEIEEKTGEKIKDFGLSSMFIDFKENTITVNYDVEVDKEMDHIIIKVNPENRYATDEEHDRVYQNTMENHKGIFEELAKY